MSRPDDREVLLAASGQLRECVAAAGNLEHLVGSLSVGPQVLSQVIPDVARQLRDFDGVLARALDSVIQLGVGISGPDRQAICSPAAQSVGELLAHLERLSFESVTAKSRLGLERTLSLVLPVLSSVAAHIDLLLDACQSAPAEMSIQELLTSIPERGSERPFRPVPVGGHDLERVVSIPPRVALKSIAAWSAAVFARQPAEWGLYLHGDDTILRLSLQPITDPVLVVRLPDFVTAPYGPLVVEAALRPFGGQVSEQVLSFPVVGKAHAE